MHVSTNSHEFAKQSIPELQDYRKLSVQDNPGNTLFGDAGFWTSVAVKTPESRSAGFGKAQAAVIAPHAPRISSD